MGLGKFHTVVCCTFSLQIAPQQMLAVRLRPPIYLSLYQFPFPSHFPILDILYKCYSAIS